jgi:hypothetical protein
MIKYAIIIVVKYIKFGGIYENKESVNSCTNIIYDV